VTPFESAVVVAHWLTLSAHWVDWVHALVGRLFVVNGTRHDWGLLAMTRGLPGVRGPLMLSVIHALCYVRWPHCATTQRGKCDPGNRFAPVRVTDTGRRLDSFAPRSRCFPFRTSRIVSGFNATSVSCTFLWISAAYKFTVGQKNEATNSWP